jgi:hypothetical protein
MICPQKPALKLPQGVRSCELLDTELSTKVATGRPRSAPACARGNVSRALQCAAKSS